MGRSIQTFGEQFKLNRPLPDPILLAGGYKKLRQSPSLVATSAAASILIQDDEFIYELFYSQPESYSDTSFDPFYQKQLNLFNLMHLSGNYLVITPQKY